MTDALPSAIDPITEADLTVLGFLQAVRSDLADIKATLAAASAPTKTGSTPFPSNVAANPVLASDATGWDAIIGSPLSADRVAVADHVSADYALEIMVGQSDPTIFLPLDTAALVAGSHLTVAVDVQNAAAANVSATLGLEWGTQSGLEAYSGSGTGGEIVNATVSPGGWQRIEETIVVPTGLGDYMRPTLQITGAQPGDIVRLTLADYLAGS